MKAIIMNHERGGSIVLERSGDFRFIKGYTSKQIGTEITVKSQSVIQYAKIAVMAACLVAVLLTGGVTWAWNTDSYSVYVDINPSVELVFNNLNRLKAVKALNEDGTALLKGLSLKGSPGDVIVALIKEAENKGYALQADGLPAVTVTVIGRGGKPVSQYADAINAALTASGLSDKAEVIVTDEDFRARAEALGVSPGKLMLAERLFASDQQTAISDIVNMPVKDLMEKIREAEGKGIPAITRLEVTPDVTPGNTNEEPGDKDAKHDNNGNNEPPAGPGNNNGDTDPPSGPANNNGNNEPPAGPGNNNGNTEPPTGPGNNNGNTEPPRGPGNNNGNGNTNPPVGPGNNNGNGNANPPSGSGNNNGNGNTSPPSGSGNNNGNGDTSPPSGSGNNNGNDNPPSGSGNNNGNDNPPGGPGSNNGNDNPPGGPGSNNGNDNPPGGPGSNNGNGNGNTNPPGGPGSNNGNGNGNTNPPGGPGSNNGNGNTNPPGGPGSNNGNGNTNPPGGPGSNNGNGNPGGSGNDPVEPGDTGEESAPGGNGICGDEDDLLRSPGPNGDSDEPGPGDNDDFDPTEPVEK